MKKILFTVLTVLGISGVIVLGSTLAIIQPIFASPDQETDSGEPQDQSGAGGDGSEASEVPQDDEPQTTDELQVATDPAPPDTDVTNQSGSSGDPVTEREKAECVNLRGSIYCLAEENCYDPNRDMKGNPQGLPLCLQPSGP